MQTGLERLVVERGKRLQGLKVGLITHPAACLPQGEHAIEALRAIGVRLVSLFGPEHGVRGTTPAGKWVPSTRDPRTGLPAYSLYGPTKVPTAAMLKGLDLLLFDLQDIGCRSYTYLSTLGCVLEGATRHKVPVLVLDRPNPLGLTRVEGGPTQPGFTSFISKYPVAYRHGMTLGELARWIVAYKGYTLSLEVLPCTGLTRRADGWESRRWVPTSPNIPTLRAARLYAATGILGELSTLTIGVGTDSPFGYVGSPTLATRALQDALEESAFATRLVTFTPTKGNFAHQRCQGLQLQPPSTSDAVWTRLNFALLVGLRRAGLPQPFTPGEPTQMFDFSCGSSAVRNAFLRGASLAVLWELFQDGVAKFQKESQPSLLYTSS